MNKHKHTAILLAVGLVVVMVAAVALYNVLPRYMADSGNGAKIDSAVQINPNDESSQPVKAPDFTVTDVDGNKISFSSLEGKPIVLNFWASWCGPCKSEMPDFQNVFAEYTNEEVLFVMVNATDGQRETQDTAKRYVEDSGFTFPVYYDVDQEAVYAYGIRALPSTIFIDVDGNIAGAVEGALSESSLRTGIAHIYRAE